MDAALFNLTNDYEVKPIDVVITEVKDVPETGAVRLSVLERVDNVYRPDVIFDIKGMFKNGTMYNRLVSYSDDFILVVLCAFRDDYLEWLERVLQLLLGFALRLSDCGGTVDSLLHAGKKVLRQEGGREGGQQERQQEGGATAFTFVCFLHKR